MAATREVSVVAEAKTEAEPVEVETRTGAGNFDGLVKVYFTTKH